VATRRQLEIFCAAAADCNFRDTADRLGVSQPAISSHIEALERSLGRKLFVRRRGTTPILSDDGRRLLETARQTLELNRRLSTGLGPGEKYRVTLGLRHYLLETVVRAAIPRFIDAYPDIDLDLRVTDDVNEMFRMVRGGLLDAGVYRGDPPIDPNMAFRIAKPSVCSIYAAPALARQIEAERLPLEDAPFILFPDHQRGRTWITRRLDEAGIDPHNVVLRSQFPDVILQWAIEGRGLALLLDTTVPPGILERIGPPLRPVPSVIFADAHAGPPIVRVVDFLEELLNAV
jgi:DNA-binding transcriptional LysR family regulator